MKKRHLQKSEEPDELMSVNGQLLGEVHDQIVDGDLLLFKRPGLISIAGRGDHSHAAMAARWKDEWFCLEVRELFGGRAVTLRSQVRRYPGRIDVYQANPDNRWPEFDRSRTIDYMQSLAGCDYGWCNLVYTALLHLPWIRLLVRPDTDDATITHRPPFCSQAVAMATRIGGGVDPVVHLADRLTEPADLARSPFYRYRFTLLDA